MNAVFVDTGGWMACADQTDPAHTTSSAARDAALEAGRILITTDFVVDETLTLIRFRLGLAAANAWWQQIDGSARLRWERVDSDRFERARNLFFQYRDKDLSFIDCTSFAIMRELRLTTVITTDGHFRQGRVRRPTRHSASTNAQGTALLIGSTRHALDNERMRASQRSRAKYPLATISAYGPDNRRATKLAVGILRRPGQKTPNPMRNWNTDTSDVRNDPRIAAEIAEWLRTEGIKDTVSHDRIIGCPHQEGIDYPIGRTCPQCPFWAGIDRFTHEPISAPVATMSPDQVLIELGKDRTTHPLEALESADAHRGVLVQPLLEVMDRGVTHPDTASEEDAQLFCYALYLLAKWRETRAFPFVIQWLSLSDAASTGLSGDVSTQDGARILAAVCDGDLEPIKRLVLNRDADEFSRGVAVAALALLAVWAEVPRDTILNCFGWLAREGLERRTNYVWGALAAESAAIEALAVFPDLRRAYDEGLIDPRVIGRSELDDVEASPRGHALERWKDRYPPIEDVAKATSWWARFGRRASNRRAEELALAAAGEFDDGPTEAYRAPPKVGRNEPCPCGSGKKYKKCCGA